MRKPGFTFLELLIALSLFSVGMISVLQVFPINRRLLVQTTGTSQAAFLAQEQLELLRSTAYASLTVGTYQARASIVDDEDSPLHQFERQTVVNYINDSYQVSNSDLRLKRILLTIYWTEHNVDRQLQLATYVTR